MLELASLAIFLAFVFSFVLAVAAFFVAKAARVLAVFLFPFAALVALIRYIRS